MTTKQWFIKLEIPIDHMFDPVDEITLKQILKHYHLTKHRCKYIMAKLDVEDAKWFGPPKGGILGVDLIFNDEKHYMMSILKLSGNIVAHGHIDT